MVDIKGQVERTGKLMANAENIQILQAMELHLKPE
jgi:hypothetical protein